MNRTIQQTYHLTGALAADADIRFAAHTGLQLVHVSAVGSNDGDATVRIGTPADDDAYLAAAPIGDSGAPVEFERADFAGGEYPRIAAGGVVVVTLDHDGMLGTPAEDVTLVLTLVEG